MAFVDAIKLRNQNSMKQLEAIKSGGKNTDLDTIKR